MPWFYMCGPRISGLLKVLGSLDGWDILDTCSDLFYALHGSSSACTKTGTVRAVSSFVFCIRVDSSSRSASGSEDSRSINQGLMAPFWHIR